MSRRLIVSGDDLGLHEAINRGVIEAHERGIVTSASVVACGRAFDHACGLVASWPSLDLGAHLTLVEESPILGREVLKTLAPGGRFPRSYRQLFLELLAGRIEIREVEWELEAQIQRLLKAGLKVTHLDSHQHTHLFPALRTVLLNLAERHGLRGIRAATRVTPMATKFGVFLAPLAKKASMEAIARGLKSPDTLWLPATSGRVTAAQLLEGIPHLPEGVTELVVHPGFDQAALASEYPNWNFDWPGELAAVTAPEVKEALARANIRLTRYSELS